MSKRTREGENVLSDAEAEPAAEAEEGEEEESTAKRRRKPEAKEDESDDDEEAKTEEAKKDDEDDDEEDYEWSDLEAVIKKATGKSVIEVSDDAHSYAGTISLGQWKRWLTPNLPWQSGDEVLSMMIARAPWDKLMPMFLVFLTKKDTCTILLCPFCDITPIGPKRVRGSNYLSTMCFVFRVDGKKYKYTLEDNSHETSELFADFADLNDPRESPLPVQVWR